MRTFKDIQNYKEVIRSKIFIGDLERIYAANATGFERHIIFAHDDLIVDLENDILYSNFPCKIASDHNYTVHIPRKEWVSLDEILSGLSYPEILHIKDVIKLMNVDWFNIFQIACLSKTFRLPPAGISSFDELKRYTNENHPGFQLSAIEKECGITKRKFNRTV